MRKKSARTVSDRGSIEVSLVENIVLLQKVHTDLAEKFDKLSKQIENLLALFEMTARSFATNPNVQMVEKDKEFLEKIDKLLDQNKTIAKGLTMMEQKIREKMYGPISQPIPQPTQQPRQSGVGAPQGMIASRPIKKI